MTAGERSPAALASAGPVRRNGSSEEGRARLRLDADTLVLAAIVLAALAIAGAMFFSADPDMLGRDVHHDRVGHFGYALDLALALRDLDPLAFVTGLLRSTVWPPVHGLVLSVVLLLGGFDPRLGIVPSLIGWTMTVVFAALIARRLFPDPTRGLFAAAVAALLVMASPTFRLLASDVMLEGLGAGVSAWAVWACARAQEQPSASRWRALALVLTLLFFLKGNYWGLVVAALALAAASDAPRRVLASARACTGSVDARALAMLLRDPLLLAAAALTALVAFLYARGPTELFLFGRGVSLYPPENLTTLAYALLFLRVALAWRRHRGEIEARLGPAGRALLYWHALPIAGSFLVPKRLSSFLWFVGPANAPALTGKPSALAIYGSAFAEGFHPAVWAAVLTLVLFALGLAQYRRFPAGARAAFVLALVASAAVLVHPHQQARFLASWIFSLWVGAGAGAALLLGWATQAWRAPAALGVTAVLAVALALATPSPRAEIHAIRGAAGPSAFALIAPTLPALDGARAVGVAATFGRSGFVPLVLRLRCRCRLPVDAPWLENLGSREAARQAMADYVAHTPSELLVVIDAPQSPYAATPFWPYAVLAGVVDAMAGQSRFAPALAYAVPEQGARVTVWRRADAAR